MSSRLTLAEVRSQLYPFVTPDNQWDPKFLRALNRVCESIMNSGKWLGTKGIVDFAVSTDGVLTLPRRFQSVLGYNNRGIPRPIYGQYQEFVEGGYGQIDEATMFPNRLLDMGEFPTMTAILPDVSGTLRLARADAADAAKTVRIYGKDAAGDVVFDSTGTEGVLITLASASQDTTQVFSEVTGVVKEVTTGKVTLSVVVAAVATQLSIYEPTETVPLYRRYKCGISEDAIRCYCKRRFVLLDNEADFVLPSNLVALKRGLFADRWENENDIERADLFWERCYKSLNDELKENRGGTNITIKLGLPHHVANLQ